MDSILKVVYSHSYVDTDNRKQCFLNGVHTSVIDYINRKHESNKDIYSIINEIKQENSDSNWDSFFRHSNFLSYYKRHYGESNIIGIEDIKDDNSIYIWPIEVGGSLGDFTSIKKLNIDGQYYEYSFIDTIDKTLLTYIKNGKVKLVINIIHDPLVHANQVYEVEKYFSENGIDPKNITIIAGNDFKEYYSYIPEGKINITYGYIMVQQAGDRLDNFPYTSSLGYVSDMVRKTDLDKNHIRSKRFLCWNRTMREQRVWLAYLALKLNMLNSSYFSFLNSPGGGERGVTDIIRRYAGHKEAEIYGPKVYSMLPYDLDTHHLSPDQKMGFPSNNNKKEFYQNSYVHITSETVFIEDIFCPFFSEKTFHAMVNLQPFIYVGCAGALKILKNWGIKTFHPFINESYDDEKNPVNRFRLIEKEIKKLNEMPIQDLHNWYHSITDTLIHNQEILRQFSPSNPFENAINYIKNLYERK